MSQQFRGYVDIGSLLMEDTPKMCLVLTLILFYFYFEEEIFVVLYVKNENIEKIKTSKCKNKDQQLIFNQS